MSLSCLLVVYVFFWKQCSTYTASSNLVTYITRKIPLLTERMPVVVRYMTFKPFFDSNER